MSIVKIRAALEVALDSMVGIIPAADIVSSNAGLFTTSSAHLLVSGLIIQIVNHTKSNGAYLVNVVSSTTFTLQDTITRADLTSSTGTGGTVKAELTQWENVPFEPFVGVPYQEVFLMAANPDNPTYGSGFYRELGYLQIGLHYPKEKGTKAISTRAELIRSTFERGNSFTKDAITVNILRTASIEPGPNTDSYICTIVKIPYWADIYP